MSASPCRSGAGRLLTHLTALIVSLLFGPSWIAGQTQAIKVWSFETADDIPLRPDYRRIPASGSVTIDSTTADAGAASVRFDCPDLCRVFLPFDRLDGLRGGVVRVTGRVKTAFQSEGGVAYFTIEVPNLRSRYDRRFPEWRASGGTEWTTYSLDLPLPDDVEAIAIGLYVNARGGGAAWFDSVTVSAAEWTWRDRARENGHFVLFTGGWEQVLRSVFSFVFVPTLLLVLALRSDVRSRIEVITWPHRWLTLALLATVPLLTTGLAASRGIGQLSWVFTSNFVAAGPSYARYAGFWAVGFWAAVVGGVFTVVWRRLRHGIDEVQLWRNAELVLRYFLMFVLLGYAWSKFFRTQFGPIPYQELDTRLGDASPFSLLWGFFSYSYPYAVFAGMGEAVGAVLLAFRRTYVVGALILLPVLSNVVFVNFAYNVGIEFESTVYLLMAVALIGGEVPRLWHALVLRSNQLPARVPSRRVLPPPWGVVFSTATLLAMAGYTTVFFGNTVRERDASQPLQTLPFPGVWAITDSSGSPGWTRLVVERQSWGVGVWTGVADAPTSHEVLRAVSHDESLRTFSMTWLGGNMFSGRYDLLGDTLVLQGTREGDPLELRLVRRQFRLDPWR